MYGEINVNLIQDWEAFKAGFGVISIGRNDMSIVSHEVTSLFYLHESFNKRRCSDTVDSLKSCCS